VSSGFPADRARGLSGRAGNRASGVHLVARGNIHPVVVARPVASAAVRLTLRLRPDGAGTTLAAALVTRSLADDLDAALLAAVQATDTAAGTALGWPSALGAEAVVQLGLRTAVVGDDRRRPALRRPVLALASPLFAHSASVTPLPRNLGPIYPADLRSAGVPGRARVEFVVTETGEVDPTTTRVLETTQPELAPAVLGFLCRARYRAGVGGGCPVKVLVVQPFEFRIDRSRRRDGSDGSRE
jgi:hypothetical protein